MDFAFSEQQDELRASTRQVLEKEAGPPAFRRVLESKTGFDEKLWETISGLGWSGVAIPEQNGGLGLGLVELCILQEEAGRAVLPAPFFSTVCLATPVVVGSGSGPAQAAFLQGVAEQGLKATLALTEREGRWDAAGVKAKAQRSDGGWRLSGTKAFIPDAHLADEIVVVARTERSRSPEEGLSLFLVPSTALKRKPRQVPSLDPTRRLCDVSLTGVEVPEERLLGAPGSGWTILSNALDRVAVALAAEAMGAAAKATEMAVAYASERIQFDRPIGSFQAISHLCANMFAAAESAKSTVYYAAWALDEAAPDASLAAATAKVSGNEAGRIATSGNIQVHGGIGFTWEHDAHLYYRRAKFCELFLGESARWRERVVSLRA